MKRYYLTKDNEIQAVFDARDDEAARLIEKSYPGRKVLTELSSSEPNEAPKPVEDKPPPHNRAQAMQRTIENWCKLYSVKADEEARNALFIRMRDLWGEQHLESEGKLGWAVKTDKNGILADTVSWTPRATMVNWLVVYGKAMVWASASDNDIHAMWNNRKDDAKLVSVRIRES